MSESATATVPRAGMLATVRNRSGIVAAVEPFDGETGRLHLVHVEYKDSRSPVEERLLWELEPGCTLLEPTALPDAGNTDAMSPGDFDALLRAARWTALSPYLDLGGTELRKRKNREDRLRALGFEDPSGNQRKEQLARNVALQDWPKR